MTTQTVDRIPLHPLLRPFAPLGQDRKEREFRLKIANRQREILRARRQSKEVRVA